MPFLLREQILAGLRLQPLLDLVSEEDRRQILVNSPLIDCFARQLRQFDVAVQTSLDADGRPERLEHHKIVGVALFRALLSKDGGANISIHIKDQDGVLGANSTLSAATVVKELCHKALLNLIAVNVGDSIRPLTLSIEAHSQAEPISTTHLASEAPFSLFVVSAILQATPYRAWVFRVLEQPFLELAQMSKDRQIHLGAKVDLHLLGAAVDVKYKQPGLEQQVHTLLGYFLPAQHVKLFIKEYEKTFRGKD
jgi:hypothetical protein